MSITPFLVLPIVGGYYYCTLCKFAYFRTARESGHRLYFRSIFYGVILVLLATLLHLILIWNSTTNPYYSQLLTYIGRVIESNYDSSNQWGDTTKFIILVQSIFLGPAIAGIFNLTQYIIDSVCNVTNLGDSPVRNLIINKAIKNNDFEILVKGSVDRQIPILFTLLNGKFYIG